MADVAVARTIGDHPRTVRTGADDGAGTTRPVMNVHAVGVYDINVAASVAVDFGAAFCLGHSSAAVAGI
jgi:hypothetical protein